MHIVVENIYKEAARKYENPLLQTLRDTIKILERINKNQKSIITSQDRQIEFQRRVIEVQQCIIEREKPDREISKERVEDLMKSLNCTLEQALDLLKISDSTWLELNKE